MRSNVNPWAVPTLLARHWRTVYQDVKNPSEAIKPSDVKPPAEVVKPAEVPKPSEVVEK